MMVINIMGFLSEIGVTTKDWEISNSAKKELNLQTYTHKNNLRKNNNNLPVSPNEEEVIQLLKVCANKLGFEYKPK